MIPEWVKGPYCPLNVVAAERVVLMTITTPVSLSHEEKRLLQEV
jgi:hypothetical protein